MNGGPTASILGVPARHCNQWSQNGWANRGIRRVRKPDRASRGRRAPAEAMSEAKLP